MSITKKKDHIPNRISKAMDQERLQSRTIDFLRFPLIVGVVFIHSNIVAVINADTAHPLHTTTWIQTIVHLFSGILPSACVPLFFFISGFLFFHHPQKFSHKLKKRVHTLLTPYLIWNLLGIISILISHFAMPEHTKWSQWDECFKAIANIFLPCDFPPNRPLWFIRNLLYVMLLAPVVKFLFTNKYKLPILISIYAIWISNSNFGTIDHKLISAFLFFSTGSYFSLNKLNLVHIIGKTTHISFIAYPLLVIANLLFSGTFMGSYIYKTSVLIEIMFAINLSALLIKNRNMHIPLFLTQSSFFIYAFHGLFISKLVKLAILILNPQSSALLAIIYFSVPVFTIAISLLIYHLLKKNFPRLTAVLMGERG